MTVQSSYVKPKGKNNVPMAKTSIKYPNLKKVSDMMWETLEEVNNTNECGKLFMRTSRNELSKMLTSENFWSLLESKVKLTNDKTRANKNIKVHNFLKTIFTNPMMATPEMIEFYQMLVDKVYNTVINFKTEPYTKALNDVTVVINSGIVNENLVELNKIVKDVKLKPEELSKLFSTIKRLLYLGSRTQLNFQSNAPNNLSRTSFGSFKR